VKFNFIPHIIFYGSSHQPIRQACQESQFLFNHLFMALVSSTAKKQLVSPQCVEVFPWSGVHAFGDDIACFPIPANSLGVPRFVCAHCYRKNKTVIFEPDQLGRALDHMTTSEHFKGNCFALGALHTGVINKEFAEYKLYEKFGKGQAGAAGVLQAVQASEKRLLDDAENKHQEQLADANQKHREVLLAIHSGNTTLLDQLCAEISTQHTQNVQLDHNAKHKQVIETVLQVGSENTVTQLAMHQQLAKEMQKGEAKMLKVMDRNLAQGDLHAKESQVQQVELGITLLRTQIQVDKITAATSSGQDKLSRQIQETSGRVTKDFKKELQSFSSWMDHQLKDVHSHMSRCT
jgi:hypothetical protein